MITRGRQRLAWSYSLRYNGMVLALDKRWARGWQALASYTQSETARWKLDWFVSRRIGNLDKIFTTTPGGASVQQRMVGAQAFRPAHHATFRKMKHFR